MPGRARRLSGLAALLAAVALAVPGVPVAQAVFPGHNGKIAISGIETVTPAGGYSFLAPGGSPSWSPDGKQIAFSSYPFGIYVMDQAGLNQRQITASRRREFSPTWSSDGKRIAYNHDSGSAAEIFVIGVDGTGRTNLTRTPTVGEVGPAWSPDGRLIAFAQEGNIFVMNADGTGRKRVTNYAPVDDYSADLPDWSPDGERLAYSRWPSSAPESDPYDYSIHVINADGTGDTEVTGDKWPMTSAWSPDGRYLILDNYPLGMSVLDLASRRETAIPNPPDGVHAGDPDWQPIPAPKRSAFKTSASFCRAEREFFGVAEFKQRYKNFGGCVSANR
jgi:Tol biopolymer transport system component